MTNDFIVYHKSDKYHIDDVIVFSAKGLLIVHRIIDETDEGFITKGDNNSIDDLETFGVIKLEQIYGKVRFNTKLFGLGKLLLEN